MSVRWRLIASSIYIGYCNLDCWVVAKHLLFGTLCSSLILFLPSWLRTFTLSSTVISIIFPFSPWLDSSFFISGLGCFSEQNLSHWQNHLGLQILRNWLQQMVLHLTELFQTRCRTWKFSKFNIQSNFFGTPILT